MTLVAELRQTSARVTDTVPAVPRHGNDVVPAAGPAAARESASRSDHPSTDPAVKKPRDNRLDFWRGLCLVDMLLVHLIHQGMSLGVRFDLWVGEYTRFAAGGFVLIAGMSIGRIFLPRARDPEKRRSTYVALWRRAGVILAVHYVAEIGYLAMYPLFATESVPNLKGQIWAILTLRAGYDLLPFYVVVVAASPVMLDLLRRGLWGVLAAASVALFTYGQWGNPWALAFPNQQAFLPVLWQALFVAGMLAGAALPRYDALARRTKVRLAAAAVAAHAVVFVAAYGPDFGAYLWLPMAFDKVPLTTGEALRYLTITLAILLVTDLLWRPGIDGSRFAAFAERLGRNSLPVFVFHVWVVQLLVRAANGLDVGGGGRLAMGAAGLAAMWAFGWLLESGGPRPAKRQVFDGSRAAPAGRRPLLFRPVGGMTSLTAATLATVFVANLEQRHISKRQLVKRQGDAPAARQYETGDGHFYQRAPWDGGPLPADATPNWVEDPDDEAVGSEEEPDVSTGLDGLSPDDPADASASPTGVPTGDTKPPVTYSVGARPAPATPLPGTPLRGLRSPGQSPPPPPPRQP